MDSTKYIGMDVHKESISIAVMDSAGKVVMESVIETKASTILQFIQGLRGTVHITFEEGTWSAWLYDLIRPHVTKVVVCNPRKSALLKSGNKSDQIDARKLAELLRNGSLSAVYHGGNSVRTLKELSRSYLTIAKDLMRVMCRLKALYRSWGIPCAGQQVYAPTHRSEWLSKITEPGVHRRAELFYHQLDALKALRQEARRELLAESRKHEARKFLRKIPCIGPIRTALLIALIQTPHRFRTKRQLWAYSGLAIETHDSAEYRYVKGQEHGDSSRCDGGALPWLLCRADRQRHETFDGPSHACAQDCRDHFGCLEERRAFRRRKPETTSSLSVSGRESAPSQDYAWRWQSGS